MKIKVLTLMALAALMAVIGIGMTASTAPTQATQREIAELERREKYGLTLRERARLAKLRGQQKVFVPRSHRTSLYPSFSTMEMAVARYTILIAQPVAQVGNYSEDGIIGTSYKFKTIEVLSEPSPDRFAKAFDGNFPAELQPFEEGDFLLGTRGGTATIDGVEVTTKYDDYEPFSLSKKYLLFVELDVPKKWAGMDMGPLSALVINDDGTLETLDRQPHEIKRAIDESFGNSIEQIKTHLKKQK